LLLEYFTVYSKLCVLHVCERRSYVGTVTVALWESGLSAGHITVLCV